MADHKLTCEVVSPERIVFSGEADIIVARGAEGELGIMANHIPIVTPLQIGELRVKNGNDQEYITVMGGYLEFNNNKATVLADVAELWSQIDVERARQKKEERERELSDAKLSEETLAEAEISLRKALLRLEIAERARR
ncbi:MAG TPA: F0F1 ATP synthase subunit epsilon [Candidatus Aquicultor sp.]|jgi:F-type H+-transporting ATPase subunit epsilon